MLWSCWLESQEQSHGGMLLVEIAVQIHKTPWNKTHNVTRSPTLANYDISDFLELGVGLGIELKR